MGMVTRKKRSTKILLWVFIAFLLVAFLFPIYWMFIGSLKDNSVLMKTPPQLYPTFQTVENYKTVLTNAKYLRYILNSLIVATGTVVIDLVLATLAGYSLSRYRYPGRKAIMILLLSAQIFPVVVIIISLYTFFRKLNLMNSYLGLMLADVAMSLPLSVWMLMSFVDSVPKSLDEAAHIDGCSRYMTLQLIVMPLMKPGMLAVGIYAFLQSWDDYMLGLVIMTKTTMKTLPVGIAETFMGEFGFDYAGMMTISVVASLPVLLLFLVFQKYMVAGLTGGAVKE
jgi:multiple sugar transport system permease protein